MRINVKVSVDLAYILKYNRGEYLMEKYEHMQWPFTPGTLSHFSFICLLNTCYVLYVTTYARPTEKCL